MGQAACRHGYTALYTQTSRLLQELAIQHGDGRYLTTLKRLAKVQVLILDEWGFEQPSPEQRRILLELQGGRYERSSTFQLPASFPVNCGTTI